MGVLVPPYSELAMDFRIILEVVQGSKTTITGDHPYANRGSGVKLVMPAVLINISVKLMEWR